MAVLRNTIKMAPGCLATAGGNPIAVVMGEFDFDSSYPTGGEALDLSALIPNLVGVFIENKSGYYFEYDYTNKKILAYNALAAHNHVSLIVKESDTAGDKTAFVGIKDGAGGAVSGVTIGHAGSGTDANIVSSTSAVAPGSEVASTFNLSAILKVRFMAWGY